MCKGSLVDFPEQHEKNHKIWARNEDCAYLEHVLLGYPVGFCADS